tara:strand:- start:421 stop:1158 length:738 start_codon:yes stop_codon:yes gene_type:complete
MKDAYYFSHDSNARNDQRIMKVRMQYGMEGYGIYFGLIEILREQQDYTLYIDDLSGVAFDLRVDVEVVSDIVLNYNLFKVEGDLFYSKSLKRRLECMDAKKQKRVEAGRLGGIASAKVKQKSTNAKPLNKTKLNKTKKNNIIDRQLKFTQSILTEFNHLGKDLLNQFISYWTEMNGAETKMRFEMEKTWDTKRRLERWANNDFGNNKKKEEIPRPVIPKYVPTKIDEKDIASSDEIKEMLNIGRK